MSLIHEAKEIVSGRLQFLNVNIVVQVIILRFEQEELGREIDIVAKLNPKGCRSPLASRWSHRD